MFAAVVPIRSFGDAKQRLAPRLDADERRSLACCLAAGVLAALRSGGVGTYVVTSDDAVAELARELGARLVEDTAGTLDDAAARGRAAARRDGHDRLLVAHADLPFPDGLGALAATGAPDGVVLVPDRHLDGTNVLVVPAAADFRFAYGVGSFERHRAEAARLGLAVEVVSPSPLGWDVDRPDDLEPPPEWGAPSWAAAGLHW